MPDVVVIARPNGAGKSTLAPALLRDTFGMTEYVNADVIAEGLSAFAPETAAIGAGRSMLTRLNELASAKKDFAFETTLASRFYAGWLRELKKHTYHVGLIFLWLKDVDLAIERVASRVRLGGHNIPKPTIRRRYERGVKNLVDLYLPVADSWRIFDASQKMPNEIARYTKTEGEMIFDDSLWKRLKQ